MFGTKDKPQQAHQDPAAIPAQLSDLHCFTETEGVITTSAHLPTHKNYHDTY